MISYTDGEDNVSVNSPGACLQRYLLLLKNGYTYWIYNSLNNISVPTELLELQENLVINRSINPTPIRPSSISALYLEYGQFIGFSDFY